jgi:glycosyltransferase involved in cell wall biosynthesis
MEIDYINGAKTDEIFGRSKYQLEINHRIQYVKLNLIEYESYMHSIQRKYSRIFNAKHSSKESISKGHFQIPYLINFSKSIFNSIDRYRYANIVKNSINKDNVKHITSQELAYLLKYLELDKTVITCYDLIPWAYENNRSSFWKTNIMGLKKADMIITVSEFSKNEIIKYVDCSDEKIKIIYPAVDHSSYYPNRNKVILSGLDIPPNYKTILYVGSEEPRQNLPTLLKSFYELKKKLPEAKLLKIGNPHVYGARTNILKLIKKLKLQNDVYFVGYVEEKELPKWYNASDLLVYPCSYAGFGLPPLEAMACGTPVITSNTTSLPEVVDDAGIMVDPYAIELMADKMYETLTNQELKDHIVKKGLKRAKTFNWDKAALKTRKLYADII